MQAILDSFAQPTGWHWLALGAVLMALEVFAAGSVILWIGMGAALTGLILLLAPGIGLAWQFVLFGVISAGGVAIWFFVFRPERAAEPERPLNQPLQRFVGRRGTVVEADAARVRVRLGDTTYTVTASMPVSVGMVVEVVSIENGRLVVRPY